MHSMIHPVVVGCHPSRVLFLVVPGSVGGPSRHCGKCKTTASIRGMPSSATVRMAVRLVGGKRRCERFGGGGALAAVAIHQGRRIGAHSIRPRRGEQKVRRGEQKVRRGVRPTAGMVRWRAAAARHFHLRDGVPSPAQSSLGGLASVARARRAPTAGGGVRAAAARAVCGRARRMARGRGRPRERRAAGLDHAGCMLISSHPSPTHGR